MDKNGLLTKSLKSVQAPLTRPPGCTARWQKNVLQFSLSYIETLLQFHVLDLIEPTEGVTILTDCVNLGTHIVTSSFKYAKQAILWYNVRVRDNTKYIKGSYRQKLQHILCGGSAWGHNIMNKKWVTNSKSVPRRMPPNILSPCYAVNNDCIALDIRTKPKTFNTLNGQMSSWQTLFYTM